MSDRLFERAVHDWLDEGSDRTPPAAIDAVLFAIKTTRQRRDLWIPRRFTQMPTYVRYAAAAAIVAVVGVGALTLFNGGPDVGGQPTLVPTASPGTSPAPRLPPGGDLAPGRYSYTGDGVRVTVTVPDGWEGGSFHVSTAPGRDQSDGASLGFRQPDIIYADPCREGSAQLVGPTVDDFVTALADLPNVTPPTQDGVTISGFEGRHLDFTVDTEGVECLPNLPGEMALYAQGGFIRTAANGQRQELWILNVAGTRLVIDASTYPGVSADVRAEIQAMVDTLVIESID